VLYGGSSLMFRPKILPPSFLPYLWTLCMFLSDSLPLAVQLANFALKIEAVCCSETSVSMTPTLAVISLKMSFTQFYLEGLSP
jgi:hypothetical protein